MHIAYDHRHHNRHGSSTPALTRARPDHWRLRIEIDYAISQIDAGHLRPGYRLQNPDGTWAEVVLVEERAEPLDAWNLTVKDAHSYFASDQAGAQPVWVHNCCRLTVAEAKTSAEKMGWSKTNERVHGQSVYYDRNSKTYYSYDADGHTGGTWKGARTIGDLRSKDTRLGTFDQDLKWIAP